jgi:hypothetical protein
LNEGDSEKLKLKPVAEVFSFGFSGVSTFLSEKSKLKPVGFSSFFSFVDSFFSSFLEDSFFSTFGDSFFSFSIFSGTTSFVSFFSSFFFKFDFLFYCC